MHKRKTIVKKPTTTTMAISMLVCPSARTLNVWNDGKKQRAQCTHTAHFNVFMFAKEIENEVLHMNIYIVWNKGYAGETPFKRTAYTKCYSFYRLRAIVKCLIFGDFSLACVFVCTLVYVCERKFAHFYCVFSLSRSLSLISFIALAHENVSPFTLPPMPQRKVHGYWITQKLVIIEWM